MILQRPLVSIDLETTGVDTEHDRIVEIAAVKLSPDGTRETRCRRLSPGVPIPEVASAIHGITSDDVADEPVFGRVARGLADFLAGCDVTGYNVKSFDVPLLAAEFARCGIAWPDGDVMIVDAYEIFKCQEPHSLARALAFFCNRDLGDDAHVISPEELSDDQDVIDCTVTGVPGSPGLWVGHRVADSEGRRAISCRGHPDVACQW